MRDRKLASTGGALFMHSATELARLVRQREISAYELIDAHLRRIEQVDPQINAVVQLDAERALDAARGS